MMDGSDGSWKKLGRVTEVLHVRPERDVAQRTGNSVVPAEVVLSLGAGHVDTVNLGDVELACIGRGEFLAVT